jgi:hypothetical protein
MTRDTFKSIGAVFAGLIAIVVLSNGTDTVLEATGVYPSIAEQQERGFTMWWMLLLAIGYRAVFTVVGGYVTAALAPRRPMRHVLALGLIGVVLGTLGAVAAAGVAPVWFSVGLIVMSLPCVWLGGRLRNSAAQQSGRRDTRAFPA